MAATLKIPRDELQATFDVFSKKFLREASPDAVDIEVMAPDWGDQFAVEGAHLIGITYEPGTNSLEFALESGDHRVARPTEVWIVKETDGFLSTIEVGRQDGVREVVHVKKAGLRGTG